MGDASNATSLTTGELRNPLVSMLDGVAIVINATSNNGAKYAKILLDSNERLRYINYHQSTLDTIKSEAKKAVFIRDVQLLKVAIQNAGKLLKSWLVAGLISGRGVHDFDELNQDIEKIVWAERRINLVKSALQAPAGELAQSFPHIHSVKILRADLLKCLSEEALKSEVTSSENKAIHNGVDNQIIAKLPFNPIPLKNWFTCHTKIQDAISLLLREELHLRKVPKFNDGLLSVVTDKFTIRICGSIVYAEEIYLIKNIKYEYREWPDCSDDCDCGYDCDTFIPTKFEFNKNPFDYELVPDGQTFAFKVAMVWCSAESEFKRLLQSGELKLIGRWHSLQNSFAPVPFGGIPDSFRNAYKSGKIDFENGIMTLKSGEKVFSVNIEQVEQLSNTISTATTIGAETRLKNWFADIVQESPYTVTHTKQQIIDHGKSLGCSERGAIRVRDVVLSKQSNDIIMVWKKAGRRSNKS